MITFELEVRRNPEFTKGFTAGKLYADGEFKLCTLEDPVREISGQPVSAWKIPKITAIPRGRYRVILTWSPRFGRVLPEILNVPGYIAIRSHAGNKVEDTEGCILVGLQDSNDNDAWVSNSRKAEGVLIAMINEAINSGREVWLTVKGGVHE